MTPVQLLWASCHKLAALEALDGDDAVYQSIRTQGQSSYLDDELTDLRAEIAGHAKLILELIDGTGDRVYEQALRDEIDDYYRRIQSYRNFVLDVVKALDQLKPSFRKERGFEVLYDEANAIITGHL